MDLIITVSTWLPDDTTQEDIRRALKQETELQSTRLVELGRTGSVTVEIWKGAKVARATQEVVQQDEAEISQTRH